MGDGNGKNSEQKNSSVNLELEYTEKLLSEMSKYRKSTPEYAKPFLDDLRDLLQDKREKQKKGIWPEYEHS